MKKVFLFLLAFAVSFQVSAHCGSCGVGGSAEDHAESEDATHHENKDPRFEEAREREEGIMNGEESDNRDEDDMNE